MSPDLHECVRTLVQAIFRLAFCDYIGIAYGHDEPGPDKWINLNPKLQVEAEKFLTGVWGAHLGDLAGLTAKTVWKQAQRDLFHRPAKLPQPEVVAPRQLIATAQVGPYRLQPDSEVAA